MFLHRRFYKTIVLLAIITLTLSGIPQALGQDSQKIESDDPTVLGEGQWAFQPAAGASGGSYLYSSGADSDILILEFFGPSIEVIYVAGPSLGTLAIEVDGTVLRTVITTAEQTAYQQSSRINYLTNESHTLRVYAQEGGVVGIDAFVLPMFSNVEVQGEAAGDDQTTPTTSTRSACDAVTVTQRVSERTGNIQANFDSYDIVLSDNGRYAAFASYATDLVPFTPGPFSTPQVYYRDRQTCTLVRVSLNSSGQQSNPGAAFDPAISGDGRYVAFSSTSTTLVTGDTNATSDLFVRDMQMGTTVRVSVATNGAQANDGSYGPALSDNGRYVAFISSASNLVAGDTNTCDLPGNPVELVPCPDVFLHDRDTDADGIFDEAGNILTTRVSISSGSVQSNGYSSEIEISGNGRYVVFHSTATNLVTGDTNNSFDVFVRDTQTSTTTRESVATGGTQSNGGGSYPTISDNGRYVAFESLGTNLSSGDTNNDMDIFVRDRTLDTTTRVSVPTGGGLGDGGYSQGASISDDGRYVTFGSGMTNLVAGDTNAVSDVFLHDRNTTTTTRVSLTYLGAQGNDVSTAPAISGNGLVVGFYSNANNLVPGDTNTRSDVFVHDPSALLPPTDLVATALSQSQIQLTWSDTPNETYFYLERSLDGVNNWVTLRQLTMNVTSFVNISLDCGTRYYYRVRGYRSSDARYSAYSNVADALTNACPVSCARTQNAQRVSLASDGAQGNNLSEGGALSADGRYVLFDSMATNLVPSDTNGVTDVFLRDRQTCQVWRMSINSAGTAGTLDAYAWDLSPDGRYVVFSTASVLGQGDFNGFMDVFVHDRLLGLTTRESVVNLTGSSGDNYSNGPAQITPDGRYVIFQSAASNLVAGDTNNTLDIFVHDRQALTTARASVGAGGVEANLGALLGSISNDGRYVAFESSSTNLVANDTNSQPDIFVRDMQANTTQRVNVSSGGTQADAFSQFPMIAGNGQLVVFESDATNLVVGDTNLNTDIFVYNRVTATTTRLSVTNSGAQSNGDSQIPWVSSDGRIVAFMSEATNLVSGDTNGVIDIFARDTLLNLTSRVSVQVGNVQTNADSMPWNISDNGRFVAFESTSTTLVSGDSNGVLDVFVARIIGPSTPAMFRPDINAVSMVNSTQDLPPIVAYTSFTTNPPVLDANSRWLMGDWDGDGEDTPGMYSNGAFHFTNDIGVSVTWQSVWIGFINRPVVAGRFDPNRANDCIGAVDSGNFPPYGLAFALYFTCDYSTTTPSLIFQWLSILLPDSQGYTGTHQFAVGDFNNDGIETVAARRGPFIAYTNTPPLTLITAFDLAQYIGTPETGDEGTLVVGDWNNDRVDTFGLYYQNGNFRLRNDLDWNSQTYLLQRIGQPIGYPTQVTTWR